MTGKSEDLSLLFKERRALITGIYWEDYYGRNDRNGQDI